MRSVTANTRRDGEEFLALATRMGVVATTTPYPLDRADQALADLAGDRLTGAAVLHVAALGLTRPGSGNQQHPAEGLAALDVGVGLRRPPTAGTGGR